MEQSGIRTLGKVFSLSFSAKKITIQAVTLLVATVILYVISAIGAGIFKGQFLPGLCTIVGWVLWLFVVFAGFGAVSAITISEVEQGTWNALPMKEGLKRVLHRATLRALVMAPLKIVAIAAGLAVIHVIADWIGRIPYIGELVWPFFLIPLIFLSAFIVLVLLILLFGTFLFPSIIMKGKESPVSELNDFLRENTLRFLGYLVITLIVISLIGGFLGVVVKTSNAISIRAMGVEKYVNIAGSVPGWMKSIAIAIPSKIGCRAAPMPGFEWATLNAGPGLSATYRVGGFIWGVFWIIVSLALTSIPFVVWCVAGTLTYLGLKGE